MSLDLYLATLWWFGEVTLLPTGVRDVLLDLLRR